MDLFLYGTLCDPIMFRNLTGVDLSAEPFNLNGFRVDRVKASELPMIVPDDQSSAMGVVLRNVPVDVLDRLNAYEAPFGYVIRSTIQNDEAIHFYETPEAQISSGDLWDFDLWADKHLARAQFATKEIGSFDPPLGAQELSQQWGMIQHRAHASASAMSKYTPATIRRKAGHATVLKRNSTAGSFYRFYNCDLEYETFDGGLSGPLTREVLHGSEAALVLPYDPDKDVVLLVEQFRIGPFFRGDTNYWMLEPVAGLIDSGETPQEAAIRECAEEAGVTPKIIEEMFSAYPSPGGVTDFHHCFLGIFDLPEEKKYLGGLEDEAEDLRLHVVPFEKAMNLIESGEISVLPLIAMLYWLERNRKRLRAAG